MPFGILNLVMDERKELAGFDSDMLMKLGRDFSVGQAIERRVFKEFILSSQVYYVDLDSV